MLIVRLPVDRLTHRWLSIRISKVSRLVVHGLSIRLLLSVRLSVIVDWLSVDGLRLYVSRDNDVINRRIVVIHIFHLQPCLQLFLLPLPVTVASNDDNDGHTNNRPTTAPAMVPALLLLLE